MYKKQDTFLNKFVSCHSEISNELNFEIKSPILDAHNLGLNELSNEEIDKIMTAELTFKEFSHFEYLLKFITIYWQNEHNNTNYQFGLNFTKLIDNMDHYETKSKYIGFKQEMNS